MYNVYDFDKTIYNGDSTIDFYLFCLKKRKSIILCLPYQFLSFIKYFLKMVDKNKFKEDFFKFVTRIDDVDLMVKLFWQENDKKIKSWYKERKSSMDIIISASPEFLLIPLLDKYKIEAVIATKIDKKDGKLLSENCYGKEKVNRLFELYGSNVKIDKCYTDSLSDIFILNLARTGFLVKKNKIIKYK